MKFLRSFTLACALMLAAGCSSISTQKEAPYGDLKRVYVEHLLTDNDRIDEAMVKELRALGYDASAGPLTMMPEKVDAIISYQARTAWDFKPYLVELNVQLKASFSGKVLGNGRYYQASMFTKTPDEVVHALIPELMRSKK